MKRWGSGWPFECRAYLLPLPQYSKSHILTARWLLSFWEEKRPRGSALSGKRKINVISNAPELLGTKSNSGFCWCAISNGEPSRYHKNRTNSVRSETSKKLGLVVERCESLCIDNALVPTNIPSTHRFCLLQEEMYCTLRSEIGAQSITKSSEFSVDFTGVEASWCLVLSISRACFWPHPSCGRGHSLHISVWILSISRC